MRLNRGLNERVALVRCRSQRENDDPWSGGATGELDTKMAPLSFLENDSKVGKLK